MNSPETTQRTPLRDVLALAECLVDEQARQEAQRALAAILERQADRHDPERQAA